ncbi:peptidylprolyl isomerase [Haloferula chungangensis]|uniref:Peptidylprolyl isomerase n=1 Tax=Haloferula chungangensis TaxID=1048331 RepID=A0ABW2L9N4_9BACT
MRPAKNFVVRVFVYSAGLLYLAGDLFLFDGPVNRKIQSARPDSPESLERAKAQGVVARVFGHSIYLPQVERAAKERLWLEGKKIEDLNKDQRRIARLAALNDLIDHQILRVKALHNADELPVSEEEIDDAVSKLAARYPNQSEMQADLAAEGIDSEEELRLRLGAKIQQLRYVETRIADGIVVGEDEGREWFEKHAEDFALAPRVRVRHIFQSTLRNESDVAKETLDKALDDLKTQRRTFEELAKTLSEDPRTKDAGGELGWMTEARLPADFGEAVFAMPVGEPALLRTKLGWHVVEVIEKKPAEKRSYEEAKAEVIAAIEASKREIMVDRLRKALRSREEIGVHVFPEMISGE